MCYHVKLGSSASKGVCISKREPQNWGAFGLHPLAVGASLTPRNTRLPRRVILPNLVVLGQTVRALSRRLALKIWFLACRLSRSLKVIGTDTDRSATYDFILTFHIASMSLSGTVSEIKSDFSRKSQTFPTSRVFNVPAEGFPWNWVPMHIRMQGGHKLEWWATRSRKMFDDICSRLDTNTRTWQTDGRTDGRKEGHLPTANTGANA